MKRLLLLLFLLFTFVAHAEEVVYMAVPPCGIASAYGTFLNFDLNVSLNDITKRYQDLFPGDTPRVMPISHLQTLIQSFGLHTLTVQGDLSSLDNSYLPAILCIVNSSSGEPLPMGHVVLLRNIQGNMVTCTDYQVGVETYSISLAQLQIVSEGKVILVSKNPISLPFPWMSVALWLTVFTSALGFVCVVHSWRQSRKELVQIFFPPVKSMLALFVLALFVSGCGKADPEGISTELAYNPNFIFHIRNV